MGISERKEREKQQKRNDIIDAAEKLFFSNGYNNTTMDKVAEVAEFSKGTLYLYFKNKEELYLAINVRGLEILKKMFEKAIQIEASGLEKVSEIGKAYLEYSKKFPNYFEAMAYYESHEMDFSDKDLQSSICEKRGHQVMEIVAEAVQMGIDDGSIRDDLEPMYVATLLQAFYTGLISHLNLRGTHLKEKHNLELQKLVDISFELTAQSLKK